MRRLNLARLIMLYVKSFEITDPAEALQYFYFLRNIRDQDGRKLFLVCVSDLAIECRDYDLLFGKMQEGGIRSQGLIDQFESIDVDPRKACEMVADELVRKGIFEDAIMLYDLAGVSFQIGCIYIFLNFISIQFQLNIFSSISAERRAEPALYVHIAVTGGASAE